MDSSNSSARFALTIVLPLVLSAAVIGVALRRAAEPPDIARAAAEVEALYADGDLVLLYPEQEVVNLSRFPDTLDALATSTLPTELDRFQRVILVRQRDDNVPPLRRMLAARATLLFATTTDTRTIELFQLDAPERVVRDLSERIDDARAWLQVDDEEVACPWSADRFECPDADWTWIGPTVQGIAAQPHRCIWMHPPGEGEMVIEFPDIEGDRVTGWYALTDYAVSIPGTSAVRLRLNAGDASQSFRSHRQSGRRPLAFDLPEDYRGPLRISVGTRRAGVRHFCWNLQVVESAATEAGEPIAPATDGGEGSGAVPSEGSAEPDDAHDQDGRDE